MKNTRIAALLLCAVIVFVAQGCASQSKPSGLSERQAYPPTIQNWLTTNQDGTYYGVGQSPTAGDEAYAIREATTIAFGEMTRSIETAAAYVGNNFAERGYSSGSEATKNRAANVIRGARTVGPVVASNGMVYVIRYVRRDEFDNQMKDAARQARAQISEAELNALLDQAVQTQTN